MQRRSFFKLVTAAVALRKVPAVMAPVPTVDFSAVGPDLSMDSLRYAQKQLFFARNYSLGFKVSKEMIEDNSMYRGVQEQMARDLFRNYEEKLLWPKQ